VALVGGTLFGLKRREGKKRGKMEKRVSLEKKKKRVGFVGGLVFRKFLN
jgi:hypothetical protein